MRGNQLAASFRLERHAALPSTNDRLRAYAEAGEPAGLVVMADEQTAGRGRQGRQWASPPGNLYASLLLRPKVELAAAATLSLVAALALSDAILRVAEDEGAIAVKWPNDVLLRGAKIAGILLEAVEESGRCAWLIIGMGVNVATAPEGLPYPTTSLAAAGMALTAEDLLRLWLAELDHRLVAWEEGGFAALRGDWLERAHGLGGMATLHLGDQRVAGRFADLGEDGAVLLENELGCLTRYTAGEIVFP